MRQKLAILALILTPVLGVPDASAQSISVSPTRLQAAVSATATSLTVKAAARSDVQVRVYAWRRGDPPTRLRRTDAVRVFPPMFRLASRQEQTVRIDRRRAMRRGECFRVLVDKLPDAGARSGRIAIRIRHSVPLCFE